MASIARLIKGFPLPLFGSVGTAAALGAAKAKGLPKFAPWALPLGVGALWFVWPAVDDGWKIEMGIMADPEAAAKAAEEAAAAPAQVELSAEAEAKVEGAYKAHAAPAETDDDKLLKKAVATGDFSYLEEKWEAFAEKSSRPGEDDDDDDDDDDDEDDDEDEDEDEDDEE